MHGGRITKVNQKNIFQLMDLAFTKNICTDVFSDG